MVSQPEQIRRIFEKQGYEVIGDHTAVKHCHWLRKSLLYHNPCYKQTFYGINSHRCMQMSPAAYQCTQKCLFCWRYQGFTDSTFDKQPAMDPETLLLKCLEAHRRLVSGFKGDERCDPDHWREAREPRHVACSLTGEPTLYPYLSDFFECCHRRGMTTFLVTNGTLPDVLAAMDTLPTQLYVSVCAPNKAIYQKLCCPLVPHAWDHLMETLHLLPSLGTRTVIRHTLVEGWNLGYEKEYASLDDTAEPWFIEPKGYVHVGYSRHRLNMENMPRHHTIKRFGELLAHHVGYELLDERATSRVVLLGNGRERWL